MKRMILLFILSVLLCSCSYKANILIPNDESQVTTKARYNLKSAIVISSLQKKEVVNLKVDIASVSFSPYPPVYKIMQDKMRKVFSTVDLVDEIDLDKNRYDILIYPTTNVAMKNNGFFEVNVIASGLEPKELDELFRSSNQQMEAYSIPFSAAALAFLTGFTVFVASPITIPASVNIIGEYAEETIGKLFSQAFDQAIDPLINNPQLRMYVEGQPNWKGKAAAKTDFTDVRQLSVKSDVDDIPVIKTSNNNNSYAIVIGIETYRQKLPKADYAVSDAKLVSAYLTKTLGYPEENVVTLINEHATRTDLDKYLGTWLKNNVENESTVFIYYSGHGAPNPKNGDAYLVPYDGDPTFIADTGYPLTKLYDNLAKLPAKQVIVALDSCFSGAGGKSVLAKGARPLVMNMDKSQLPGKNIAVLAAASGDQISSSYEEKGHGVFTYFFLKGIKEQLEEDKLAKVELGELYNYLKPKVERVSRKAYNAEQTPQLILGSELLRKLELR